MEWGLRIRTWSRSRVGLGKSEGTVRGDVDLLTAGYLNLRAVSFGLSLLGI